jgi:hypothetical protein
MPYAALKRRSSTVAHASQVAYTSTMAERLRGDYSFAPLGLVDFPLLTHGLRRGLHSYAASRLSVRLRGLRSRSSRWRIDPRGRTHRGVSQPNSATGG